MGVRFPSPAPTSLMSDLPYGFDSFVGRVVVWSRDDAIARIGFVDDEAPWRAPSGRAERALVSQLQRYFDNPRHQIKGARLLPASTRLQETFRALLLGTVAGELLSYATVAMLLGTSPRAVGGLCASNPYPIVVPCHRVIAKNGLGGYTGPHSARDNLALKRRLIDHERAAIAAS